MNRQLDDRERNALVFLIEHGTDVDAADATSAADRRRWLAQVHDTRVVGRCACGTCPSIELVVGDAPAGRRDVSRVVLEAGTDGELLLLFVDEDRLSYLELAPIDPDGAFAEFPAVERLTAPGG